MKKALLIFVIGALILGCDSDFDFESSRKWNYTKDEDGDPVIEDIDEEEYREEFRFGNAGGYCYGYGLPDAEVATIDISGPFPPSYDLSKYLPEVRSQGAQGSCVAWATGYYLKSFQENYEDILLGNPPQDYEMSPAFIYNQIKVAGCADGSVIQDALDTIQSLGIPDWSVMPYDENDCSTQPDDPIKVLAQPNHILEYFYLDENILLEQAKAFINRDQPIVIGLAIDPQYFGARDDQGQYIYRKYKEGVSAHAMLVVGYDDAMNAFKVVNSWGKDWGNNGFVWLDYKAFTDAKDVNGEFKVLCEAWVATDFINFQPASVSYNSNNSSR